MNTLSKVMCLAVITLAIPASALAQTPGQQCAQRTSIVDTLANKYGEARQSIGLGANNAMVEVFASPTTGTWTILVSMPNGVSCLVASGQAFEAVAELPAPKGDDA